MRHTTHVGTLMGIPVFIRDAYISDCPEIRGKNWVYDQWISVPWLFDAWCAIYSACHLLYFNEPCSSFHIVVKSQVEDRDCDWDQ